MAKAQRAAGSSSVEVGRGKGPPVRLPEESNPELKPANDVDTEHSDKHVAKFATLGDTRARDTTKRVGLEFDEEKVTDDLGPAKTREAGAGYSAWYFNISAKDHELLEALAEARGEKLAALTRKILEHKLLKDPEAPVDTSTARLRISVSEEMRERIDQAIDGTTMKRSEFIAQQVESYLRELTDQAAQPAP